MAFENSQQKFRHTLHFDEMPIQTYGIVDLERRLVTVALSPSNGNLGVPSTIAKESEHVMLEMIERQLNPLFESVNYRFHFVYWRQP